MAPGTDTIIQRAAEQRNLLDLFGALPLLRDLDTARLREISHEIEWFSLPGGATLFEAGQAADGLYVVINGALEAHVREASGLQARVGSILPGESIGEMELITGKSRTATVTAVRDTELARLPGTTFDRLVARSPESMRHVAKALAHRLELQQAPGVTVAEHPRTFAVIPHDGSVDPRGFAELFVKSLARIGRAEMVLQSIGNEQTTHWFHRFERAHDFVVYVGDAQPTTWTNLCLRQAQSTIVVVGRDTRFQPSTSVPPGKGEAPGAKRAELVLYHAGSSGNHCAHRWQRIYPGRRLHHVDGPDDAMRVARLMAGRGVGIVLSGGGARGFAHIGVMRALRDARIPIDAIGGTSIGAIIAAGWAAGWDCQQMVQRMRRSFVDTNPLNDYTLPLVSLVAGGKVGRLLRREFGELDIEDLRLPFYCVSANLTSGQIAVHRSGKAWFWLRASIAIPGVLPPVFTQQQVHVDGATMNNLPVDIMHEQRPGFVMAVDVGADRSFGTDLETTEVPPWWKLHQWLRAGPSRIGIMQILWRAGMINSTATTLAQRQLTDLIIRPPLERIDLLDWRSFDRAMELGYRCATEALDKHAHRLASRPSPS
jgi:NTE family protein